MNNTNNTAANKRLNFKVNSALLPNTSKEAHTEIVTFFSKKYEVAKASNNVRSFKRWVKNIVHSDVVEASAATVKEQVIVVNVEQEVAKSFDELCFVLHIHDKSKFYNSLYETFMAYSKMK